MRRLINYSASVLGTITLALISNQITLAKPTPQGQFEMKLEPISLSAKALDLQMIMEVKPKFKVGDSEKVTFTVETKNGLQFMGEPSWEITLDSTRRYSTLLSLKVVPNDTSGIHVTISVGNSSATYARFFVSQPDTLKYFLRHPRWERPPIIGIRPFVDEAGLNQTVPNNRWYKIINLEGSHVGYYHLKREKSDSSIAPLLITHEIVTNDKAQRALRYRIYCEDNLYFTPRLIYYQGKEGDFKGRGTVDIVDGLIKDMSFGDKGTKMPSNCMVEFNIFESIENLKFDTGTEFEYTSLKPGKRYSLKETLVKYIGKEFIQIEKSTADSIELHKFERTAERSEKTYLYVDETGTLILFKKRSMYFSLSSKERALGEVKEFDWRLFEKELENSLEPTQRSRPKQTIPLNEEGPNRELQRVPQSESEKQAFIQWELRRMHELEKTPHEGEYRQGGPLFMVGFHLSEVFN